MNTLTDEMIEQVYKEGWLDGSIVGMDSWEKTREAREEDWLKSITYLKLVKDKQR